MSSSGLPQLQTPLQEYHAKLSQHLHSLLSSSSSSNPAPPSSPRRNGGPISGTGNQDENENAVAGSSRRRPNASHHSHHSASSASAASGSRDGERSPRPRRTSNQSHLTRASVAGSSSAQSGGTRPRDDAADSAPVVVVVDQAYAGDLEEGMGEGDGDGDGDGATPNPELTARPDRHPHILRHPSQRPAKVPTNSTTASTSAADSVITGTPDAETDETEPPLVHHRHNTASSRSGPTDEDINSPPSASLGTGSPVERLTHKSSKSSAGRPEIHTRHSHNHNQSQHRDPGHGQGEEDGAGEGGGVPETREDEHKRAWKSDGARVWRSIPEKFTLNLDPDRRSRRSSDESKEAQGGEKEKMIQSLKSQSQSQSQTTTASAPTPAPPAPTDVRTRPLVPVQPRVPHLKDIRATLSPEIGDNHRLAVPNPPTQRPPIGTRSPGSFMTVNPARTPRGAKSPVSQTGSGSSGSGIAPSIHSSFSRSVREPGVPTHDSHSTNTTGSFSPSNDPDLAFRMGLVVSAPSAARRNTGPSPPIYGRFQAGSTAMYPSVRERDFTADNDQYSKGRKQPQGDQSGNQPVSRPTQSNDEPPPNSSGDNHSASTHSPAQGSRKGPSPDTLSPSPLGQPPLQGSSEAQAQAQAQAQRPAIATAPPVPPTAIPPASASASASTSPSPIMQSSSPSLVVGPSFAAPPIPREKPSRSRHSSAPVGADKHGDMQEGRLRERSSGDMQEGRSRERRSSTRDKKEQKIQELRDAFAEEDMDEEYEARREIRLKRRQVDLRRRIGMWASGVDGVDVAVPDIDPTPPSPSVATAQLRAFPLVASPLVPPEQSSAPTESKLRISTLSETDSSAHSTPGVESQNDHSRSSSQNKPSRSTAGSTKDHKGKGSSQHSHSRSHPHRSPAGSEHRSSNSRTGSTHGHGHGRSSKSRSGSHSHSQSHARPDHHLPTEAGLQGPVSSPLGVGAGVGLREASFAPGRNKPIPSLKGSMFSYSSNIDSAATAGRLRAIDALLGDMSLKGSKFNPSGSLGSGGQMSDNPTSSIIAAPNGHRDDHGYHGHSQGKPQVYDDALGGPIDGDLTPRRGSAQTIRMARRTTHVESNMAAGDLSTSTTSPILKLKSSSSTTNLTPPRGGVAGSAKRPSTADTILSLGQSRLWTLDRTSGREPGQQAASSSPLVQGMEKLKPLGATIGPGSRPRPGASAASTATASQHHYQALPSDVTTLPLGAHTSSSAILSASNGGATAASQTQSRLRSTGTDDFIIDSLEEIENRPRRSVEIKEGMPTPKARGESRMSYTEL